MPYTPHTAADIDAMLSMIGAESIEELFASLPEAVRLPRELALPPSRSEEEVRRIMKKLAAANRGQDDLVSFLGGGIYDCIIPAAIDALAGRSEFLTAYTPYQAEVSQGTLQVIYEWQTYICRLTGLVVANASMYDGATALCEAISIGVAQTRRRKVVLPRLLNPRYRRVVQTMLAGENVEIVEAPAAPDGITDVDAWRALIDASVGAVVVQNPNFLGAIEPVQELAPVARAHGSLLIACVNPVSLGLLKSPGEYEADLAVGEAQPFGIPTNFGGPLLGFLAARSGLERRLPGRVVGKTLDRFGRPGYVLTLQTREQHIRREKATSNICTNQGLNALRATIYLALLGADGLQELATANHVRCEAFRAKVARIEGVTLPCTGPVFNETVIRLRRSAHAFCEIARQKGILAGIPLKGFADCSEEDLLVALTEKRTAAEIDRYVELLGDFLACREGI